MDCDRLSWAGLYRVGLCACSNRISTSHSALAAFLSDLSFKLSSIATCLSGVEWEWSGSGVGLGWGWLGLGWGGP